MNVTTPSSLEFPFDLLLHDSYNQSLLEEDIQTSTSISSTLHNLTASLLDNVLNDTATDNVTNGNQTAAVPGQIILPLLSLQKIVIPTVCAIGVVLNALNLLVLTERCLKESPYTYLTAMAVFCLTILTMSLTQDICMHNFPSNFYCYTYVFNIYFPISNICSHTTVWLTAVLTIERFLFVKHPLWARVKCNNRSAKVIIVVVTVLMALFNIPRFLMYQVVPNDLKGPDFYTYRRTAFCNSQAYHIISWIHSVTIQLIPLSILSVFNFYLVYAVHRARFLRRRMHIRNNMEAEWSREQNRLTITLIAIVFFFLICIMPSAFIDLNVTFVLFGRGMTRSQFAKTDFYVKFQRISNLLIYCQLSFNFLLYSAFNDKFLAVFKRVMRRWSERIRRGVCCGRSGSGECHLMRLDAANGPGGGRDRNWMRVQLRSSNNSMSSGKDNSQTKSSLLEISS